MSIGSGTQVLPFLSNDKQFCLSPSLDMDKPLFSKQIPKQKL